MRAQPHQQRLPASRRRQFTCKGSTASADADPAVTGTAWSTLHQLVKVPPGSKKAAPWPSSAVQYIQHDEQYRSKDIMQLLLMLSHPTCLSPAVMQPHDPFAHKLVPQPTDDTLWHHCHAPCCRVTAYTSLGTATVGVCMIPKELMHRSPP